MQILFDHSLVTVWYHSSRRIVHHRIHRATHANEMDVFKAALLSGTEAIRKHTATKWLSDDRCHYVLPTELQDWAHAEWFPQTRSAGWRHWAIIQPDAAVAKLFVARMAAAFGALGVQAKLFGDVHAGISWLDSLPEEPPAT